MVLSDQQLRQELINHGEIVPPITQRNREQLRARLELLRSRNTRQAAASPSRTRSGAAASPSRAASSPSRTRGTASPSRSLTTSSPSRTRASGTATTGGSGRTTRSKQTPNLIELSDSEAEASSTGVLATRSTRSGQTAPHGQTRSIALRGQHVSPTSSASGTGGSPGKVADDVEQSIARHRREIKQLLDSARDRTRGTDAKTTSPSSRQRNESGRSSSPSRTRRESSKSDDEDRKKSSSSSSKRSGKSSQSFCKKLFNLIKTLLKAFLIGSLLLGTILYFTQDGTPHQEAITCSVKNATTCDDMKPVIAAVRKQLQVRTGEVDCGFRQLPDVLVTRAEIEKYLNEKGLKFNLGNEERWKALITYIVDKPVPDILIWNKDNQQTNSTIEARKLSSKDAIRSLTCRARQDIIGGSWKSWLLFLLGSAGLLKLAWYLLRPSKHHHNDNDDDNNDDDNNDDDEKSFKTYLEKAKKILQDQYEKHVQDPRAQPWLAINHIRDKLIPAKDQERVKHIWERVKNEISKQDSRIRSELQEIDGKKSDVWRWIKSVASSPGKTRSTSSKNSTDETDDYPSSDVGLTECLKLRNCFRSDDYADEEEIDRVVDNIQQRCAKIQRIEHIGLDSVYVYLKFSSKAAAAQGYHALNNWNYQGRDINVKYLRLNRYYDHFPEAKNLNNDN